MSSESTTANDSAAPTKDAADEPWNRPPDYILFLRKYIWVIGIVLGITMITVMRPFLMNRPEPPPVLTVLPTEFELLDHHGEAFGPEELQGKVWVVGFVFTRCPSTCPVISQAMVRFQEQIIHARITDDVQMLTVTVDPKHDRPDVLAEYAEKIGADTSSWTFVTGETSEIDRFVVEGFKLAVGEKEDKEPGVFDIAHSSKLALVDRHGNVRGYYSLDDESLNELFHRALRTTSVGPNE